MEMLQNSVYFGVLISLGSYAMGMLLKRKTNWTFMNPLLVSIVLCIIVITLTGTSYKDYNAGASWLSYLLTPATVCLAVPLYQQMELLKKNYRAIISGITAGVLSSLTSILLLALLFGWDHASYATFLPKSITPAIGMGRTRRYCSDYGCGYYHNRRTWQYFRRKFSETVAHKRTDSQRHCFGFGFSCHRNGTRHGNGNYRRSYKRIVNSGLRHTDRGRCIIVRHDNLINYHGEQLPNYLYCFISSSARSSPSSFAFCKFCKQSCFFLVSP